MSNVTADIRLTKAMFDRKNVFLSVILRRRQSALAFPFNPKTPQRTTSTPTVVNIANVSTICQDSQSHSQSFANKLIFSCLRFTLVNFQRNLSTNFNRNIGPHSHFIKTSSVLGSRHPWNDPLRNLGVRLYSTDNREGGNEIKGVVFHIPNPIDWLKNLWYQFVVQGWIDSSFNGKEFLFGAKQAVCHLTRLAVLKDFETMKLVASAEVISRMKEIVSAFSLEQLQSIEILPENINLAKFTVSSIRNDGEGSYAVSIDLFCLAVRMFQTQPILIQMIIKFCRDYEYEKESEWQIESIQEFNIKELVVSKDENRK